MPQRSFNSFAVVDKDPLDVFVEEQPRAVNKLIEHACREIVGVRFGVRFDGGGHGGPFMKAARRHAGRMEKNQTTMQGASIVV
jgi:hypothetical protein